MEELRVRGHVRLAGHLLLEQPDGLAAAGRLHAVKRANERRTDAGELPLPEGLTPHKLRYTFASALVALGVDPGSVMDQIGHTDPAFTLRVYRHGMRRDDDSKRALRVLVGLEDQPLLGSRARFLHRLRLRR